MSPGRAKRRRREARQSPAGDATPPTAQRWMKWVLGFALVLVLVWGAGSLAGMLHRFTGEAAETDRAVQLSQPRIDTTRRAVADAYVPPTTFAALKQESFQAVDAFLRQFPGDVDGLAKAAQLAGIFGEKEVAKQYWRRCVELMPVHLHAWYALAWLAMHDANYEEMADYARRALVIAPDDPKFRDLLGYALIEMGAADESVAVLEESVARNLANCDTYTLLGKVHLMERNYQQAVRYYKLAVQQDPNWSKALYGLGTAHARLGEREQAQQALARFQETQSKVVVQSSDQQLFAARHDVALIYRGLGELYARHGDRRRADEMQYRSTQFDLAATNSQATSLHHMSGRISGETPE